MIPAQKILVVRYRFLGDTILTVPFLRNLRYSYPDAQIDVLVGPNSGEVLNGCPYVDNFIVYDTTRFHKYDSGEGSKRSFLSYVFQLRKNKYDMALLLKRSISSALLALLIGAKYRIGYDTEGRSFLLTHKVPFDPKMHEVKSCLSVLEPLKVEIKDDYLEAWISKEEDESIRKKVPELESPGQKVLIHAAAAHPDKIYPKEHWVAIIKRLKSEYHMTPFFTGAPSDREFYEELEATACVKSVNMAGELNIRESMSLYKYMNLAVCVDSGPAHLASALGVPTLTPEMGALRKQFQSYFRQEFRLQTLQLQKDMPETGMPNRTSAGCYPQRTESNGFKWLKEKQR